MSGIINQLLSETNESERQIVHGFGHVQRIDFKKYGEGYGTLHSRRED